MSFADKITLSAVMTFVVLAFALLIVPAIAHPHLCKIDVEVGQVWVEDVENPWVDDMRYRVADIRGEWVRLEHIPSGVTRDTKVAWMRGAWKMEDGK